MKMKRYKLSDIFLTEAKIDLIKKKYPNYSTYLDFFKEVKPKYLEWIAKEVKEGEYKNLFNNENPNLDVTLNYADILDKIKNRIELIKKFDELSEKNKIDLKDINKYRDFEALEIAIGTSEYYEAERKKEVDKEKDANKIYEDQDFLILSPNTMEASCKYGKGTKWCISASDGNEFWNYTSDGSKFLFIINKKTNNKWAIDYNESNPFKIEGVFNAADDSISLEELYKILPSKIRNIISKTIKQNEGEIIIDNKKYKFLKTDDQLYVGIKQNNSEMIIKYYSIEYDLVRKKITIMSAYKHYLTKEDFEVAMNKINQNIIKDLNWYFGTKLFDTIEDFINKFSTVNIKDFTNYLSLLIYDSQPITEFFVKEIKLLHNLFENSKIEYKNLKRINIFLNNLNEFSSAILQGYKNKNFAKVDFDLRGELFDLKNKLNNSKIIFNKNEKLSDVAKEHIKAPANTLIDAIINKIYELNKKTNKEHKNYSLKSIFTEINLTY